jgi:hypothetical protein
VNRMSEIFKRIGWNLEFGIIFEKKDNEFFLEWSEIGLVLVKAKF